MYCVNQTLMHKESGTLVRLDPQLEGKQSLYLPQMCGKENFIDYGKMNIGKHFGWKPHTSPYFWDLLGIDQFLHQVTYLAMLAMLTVL